MRWLLVSMMMACGVDAQLYEDATWWPREHVAKLLVSQARVGEAIVRAEFYDPNVRPVVEVLSGLETCEMRGFSSRWLGTSLDAGRITLDAGGGQELALVYNGQRYQPEELVPLTVGPGVRFSVATAGGALEPFTIEPAMSMPGTEVAFTEPELVGERVDDEPVTLRWAGSDPYAVYVVDVVDWYGQRVSCTFGSPGSLTMSFDEEPWSQLADRGPLVVEVEQRRTRYVTLPEGPLLLQTAYRDGVEIVDPDYYY